MRLVRPALPNYRRPLRKTGRSSLNILHLICSTSMDIVFAGLLLCGEKPCLRDCWANSTKTTHCITASTFADTVIRLFAMHASWVLKALFPSWLIQNTNPHAVETG